jgi:hypothetical protein
LDGFSFASWKTLVTAFSIQFLVSMFPPQTCSCSLTHLLINVLLVFSIYSISQFTCCGTHPPREPTPTSALSCFLHVEHHNPLDVDENVSTREEAKGRKREEKQERNNNTEPKAKTNWKTVQRLINLCVLIILMLDYKML